MTAIRQAGRLPDGSGPPRTRDPRRIGCLIGDKDKDGVKDDVDARPDEPDRGSGSSANGPLRSSARPTGIRPGEVQDGLRSSRRAATWEVLEAVQSVAKAHPEIKHLRIEGHTDKTAARRSTRSSAPTGAASVKTWLVKHGIEAGRLSSTGFGPDPEPIDTNETEQGKKNNRRKSSSTSSEPHRIPKR